MRIIIDNERDNGNTCPNCGKEKCRACGSRDTFRYATRFDLNSKCRNCGVEARIADLDDDVL